MTKLISETDDTDNETTI